MRESDPLETALLSISTGQRPTQRDIDLLTPETQKLSLLKLVDYPEFTKPGAERTFGEIPGLVIDGVERRKEITRWLERILKPELELQGMDVLGEKVADRVSLKLLTVDEERELFLTYNYARYRLSVLANGELARGTWPNLAYKELTECGRWLRSAINVQHTLTEFHYPFVVGQSSDAAATIRRQYRCSVKIAELFGLAIEELRKAINSYDSRDLAKSPRFVSYAGRSLKFNIPKRWLSENAKEIIVTEPIEDEGPPQGEEYRPAPRIKPGVKSELLQRLSADVSGPIHHPPPQPPSSVSTDWIDPLLPEDNKPKLDHFAFLASVRKAAVAAFYTKEPSKVFRNALQGMNAQSVDADPEGNVFPDTSFASSEWRLVWLRRLLRIGCAQASTEHSRADSRSV